MKHIATLLFSVVAPVLSNAQTWLDPTFGIGGVVDTSLSPYFDEAQCTVIQPDGKIAVAGRIAGGSPGFDVLVARFDSDGNLDPTFGSGGFASHDVFGSVRILDLALQADGKLVLVGWVMAPGAGPMDKLVVRFNANGTIDPSFGAGGVLILDNGFQIYDEAYGVAVQSDGKIVIVGHGFDGFNKTFYIGRLNPDGTFDSSFAGGTGYLDHHIAGGNCESNDVAIMSDGRIVVVGGCSVQNPWPDPTIYSMGTAVRYLADGTLDLTFGDDGIATMDVGFDIDNAFGVAVQNDDKVLLTGVVCESCSEEWAATMRLLADGTRDMNFGTDGTVIHRSGLSPTRGFNVVLDGAGNIMVVGSFKPAIGEFYSYLVRLLDDGSPDPMFGVNGELLHTNVGTGEQTPGMALQTDGKILLAGHRGETWDRSVLLLRYLTTPITGVEHLQTGALQMISADAFGVVLTSDISANMEYDVTDMTGKAVAHGRANLQAAAWSHIGFDAPLRVGAYAIVLRDGSSLRALRFVVTQ